MAKSPFSHATNLSAACENPKRKFRQDAEIVMILDFHGMRLRYTPLDFPDRASRMACRSDASGLRRVCGLSRATSVFSENHDVALQTLC